MKQTELPNIKAIYSYVPESAKPNNYKHWYLLIDENNQIHTFNNTFGVFNWRGNLEIGMSSVSNDSDTTDLLEKYNWIQKQIATQSPLEVFDEFTGSTYQDLIDCKWFIDEADKEKYASLVKSEEVSGYKKLWNLEVDTKKPTFKK